MKQNDFTTDLKYSLDHRECEGLDAFYHRTFPGLERIEIVEDRELQRQGIDKILWFRSGYKVTIDEKKRRTDYGDILLEIWSVWEQRKRGWLFYSKCDYIVYVVMPTQIAYLLPVLLLKRAWHKNQRLWLEANKEIVSQNSGYKTVNVPIPSDVLLNAIAAEMRQEI